MADKGGRWFSDLRKPIALVTILAGASLLSVAVTAARAAPEPGVQLYDITVTGALRTTFSLPSKPLPLDVAWSETSKWTETYKGVRLEVRPSLLDPERVELKLEGKGKVAGSIKYAVSAPRSQSCGWSTTRSESASVRLQGTPYSSTAPGATSYRLAFDSGRSRTGLSLRPANCTYFEGKWAKFAGARIGPGGGVAEGTIDTRATRFEASFAQSLSVGFPVQRLSTGAGFTLSLKGKTKQQSGRLVSEGTARIVFVPRP